MGLITDYNSLLDALQSYNDNDRADYVAECPTFIALAEKTFGRLIRSRETSFTTTLTTDADGYVALPSDFLRFRSFTSVNGNLSQTLTPLSQGSVATIFPIDSAESPYYVSISGDQLRVTPRYAADVVMEYDRRFVDLGPSNATNWVLADHSDLYLFGSLAHAAVWLKDANEAAFYQSQARDILDQINTQFGMDMYNMASVTTEGPTP